MYYVPTLRHVQVGRFFKGVGVSIVRDRRGFDIFSTIRLYYMQIAPVHDDVTRVIK